MKKKRWIQKVLTLRRVKSAGRTCVIEWQTV